jgi:2-dehydropantoate 2-reductase
MRILMVGAGAVGGYFGARLLQAGRDVTFLVRAKRAAEIRENGLQILSPHGDVTLQPKLVTADSMGGEFDVILAGVKSYALEGAMNDFAAAVGPATMIFPALNGMRHLDTLIDRFGEGAVIGGVCKVAGEVDSEGRIRQLARFQSLEYGERNGERSSRIEALHQTLSGAGFDATISERIMSDMWQKWVQLSSLGAVTCLFRGNIGEVAAAPGGAELAAMVLSECAAVAEASGYPTSPEFLTRHRSDLTAEGVATTSSMYRDLMKGAPVEADTIVGDMVERGQKLGLKTPLLRAAYVSLSIYQRRIR